MTYPDPHTPPPPATQVSRAFKADRPMMSGQPPFPERVGQAVAPQYQSTTDKVFGPDDGPTLAEQEVAGPKDDLDPADKAALRDPNPASLGGHAHPIMRWFSYEHLPNERVRGVSRQFSELAWWIDQHLPNGPEKSTALRKLLEGKDAAVRTAIEAEEDGR